MKKLSMCIRTRSSLVAAIAVSAISVQAQTLQDGLDEFFTEQVRIERVPAAAIVVVRNGAVIYQATRGAGTSQDTPFALGTTGQIFTALQIMRMVEQGKIGLDEKIPRPSATYRQLLSHTSRLPEFLDTPGYESRWDTNPDALFKLTANLERPKNYTYANTNYLLLTEAIARLTQKQAHDAIKAEVLVPLGMVKAQAVTTQTPLGFEDRGKGPVKVEAGDFGDARHYGAGWTVTPSDLRSLCLAWDTMPILKKATWTSMMQRVSGGDFGLGLEVGKTPNDRAFVGMEGGLAGYSSGIISVPSLKVNIAIVCNLGGVSAYAWASDLVDIIVADDDL